MKIDWTKVTPHVVAIGVFLVLVFAYCKPLLDGQRLQQGDILVHKGMSKQIEDHRAQYGEEPLWLGTAFSGMPAFTVSVRYPSNVIGKIQAALNSLLPHPTRIMFMLALGFYILLIAFRIDPWLSIAGAIVFAFSSNFLISIEAGHNTKVMAIAYMPAVVGGAILAFNGRWILGGLVAALFGALLINSGHFQIIYYTMIVLLAVGITYLVKAIREKTITSFWKPVAALAVAALAGALPNYSKLHNTQAHTPESMRGGNSELSAKQGSSGGLEFEYALNDWSYGIDESLTLMFPFYECGGSQEVFKNSETSKLTRNDGPLPLYKGPQRFHSPIYVGASVFFLFFFAIFLVKGYNRWWIFAVAALSLFFAWGSHFALVNKPLFEYAPLFNKFRTPTMALCMIGMAIPLLGLMAVHKLIKQQGARQANLKAFRRAAIVASVLIVLVLGLGLAGDFTSPRDAAIFGEGYQTNPVYDAFLKDRQAIYMRGLLRTVIFAGLAAGLIYFFIKQRIKSSFLIGGLAALFLVDAWSFSRRYFNDDNFATQTEYTRNFVAPPSSQQIMQDADPHYRVLNFASREMFSDGITSYNHKNILGNSSAKVQLYQDMLQVNDSVAGELSRQINMVPQIINANSSNPALIQLGLQSQTPILNMLNAKYIILGPEQGNVIVNQHALGNAWFVRLVEFVSNADDEYARLARFNPQVTAVVQDRFREQVGAENFQVDSGATISLTEYRANRLTYESRNSHEGFVVFSEVYYQNGWNCYIDEELVPITKVNYALRGVRVPSGEHNIVMKFEPPSYKHGERIGSIGSLFFGLVLLAGMGWLVRDWRKKQAPSKS